MVLNHTTMVCGSTIYYRKNRESKRVIYQCPQCDYSTTGSKITLKNHINAAHVCESERPFQCQCCNRGFAQKAHLIGHLKKVHNIETIPKKISTLLYIITVTDIIPTSKRTLARRVYYIKHHSLKSRDIYKKKHSYLSSIHLKNHDIHYDVKKGFIIVQKIELVNPIRLKMKQKRVVIV